MLSNCYRDCSKDGKTACCGILDYDPVKELCCKKGESREVQYLISYKSCCGMIKYDPSHQICCHFGGSWITKTRRKTLTACCGLNLYDPTVEVCCQNKDVARTEIISGGKTACCGLTTYNPDEDLCCGGTVQRQIWFAVVSQFITRICCNGSLYSIRINNSEYS